MSVGSVIIMSLPCVIPVICVCFSWSVALTIDTFYWPLQRTNFGFANFLYWMCFFLYSINVCFYLYYFLPPTLCLLCLILSPKVENLLDFRAFFCPTADKAMCFALSIALAASHNFEILCLIIIQLKIFSNFSCDLFLMHELFGSMLFHFQIAEIFLDILLLLIPNFILLYESRICSIWFQFS